MPGPIAAAGAQTNPTRYAALTQQGRELTGLVTHRSPYRDGAVAYQASKFYGASRFDTMIDGINREATNILTDRRRPGSSVFNANTFPAINSFYAWSFIQNSADIMRTIVDGSDGVIYDATPGQKTALFTKSAGAGNARFQGVNTQLFFGNGVDTKKIMRSAKTWAATTTFKVGSFIIDPAGRIQSIQANPQSRTISQIEIVTDPLAPTSIAAYLKVTFTTPAPTVPSNQTVSFSGLTNYPALNGQTLTWRPMTPRARNFLALTPNQLAFRYNAVPYGPAADTGTAVALTADDGITAGAPPVWGTVWGQNVTDGTVRWTCFGSAVENWGLSRVPDAPASSSGKYPAARQINNGESPNPRYWNPFLSILHTTFGNPPTTTSLIDSNGNIQVAFNSSLVFALESGATEPSWAPTVGGVTKDGTIEWINYGVFAPWYALTLYGGASGSVANPCVILDSNGNLQIVSDPTVALISGGAAPAWATDPGQTTVDGSITWTCVGTGSVLWSGVYQYAWSAHAIDGSVSTATPITLVANGGLGPSAGFALELDIDITGTAAQTDDQVDKIYLWRTAQDKSTLILLDTIPNPRLTGTTTATYYDVSLDQDLNAQIIAPVSSSNDPPQASMTGPAYHLQRIWAIVDNKVVWSGGPDTITGNGNTTFPPLNFFAYIGRPVALKLVTVQNGGILVLTTRGTYIILGDGTASNPFYSTEYFNKVSLLGPNAVELYNNRLYLMESNGKVSALAIEYPFNPQTGYDEIGFPIGDQFKKVTTGGLNAPLYDPSTAYLSWNVQDTDETGMYVADGQVGWFRLGLLMPPEQGFNWSPRAAIAAGTSAVQAIETAAGKSQLLIGPPAGTPGPILVRDATKTVWTDNGTPYPAWDVRGVTLLCSTGQWAEIAHISTKSQAVGARPTVSIRLNEIAITSERPWDVLHLQPKSNDPPLTRASKTVYSDRYVAEQNGKEITGDCIMTRFDYGSQAVGDELLDWGTMASVHNEREEEAAKAGG